MSNASRAERMSFEFIRLIVNINAYLNLLTAVRMAKNVGVLLSHKLGFKLLGSFVAFLCLLTWPLVRFMHDTTGGFFGHKKMRGM